MKNKNGFTLVELIAVIIIFIIITLLSIFVVNKMTDSSRIRALIKDANTFAKGAMSKEVDSEDDEIVKYDSFHNTVDGKVCYSITDSILSKYVEDNNKKYRGSVEVCYDDSCTYTTKVWLTDGKYYIDGLSDPTDDSEVSKSFSTEYPESCGIKAIGGGTGGDLLTADFDYTGGEQKFNVILDGVYALETWGAQGGMYKSYIGGYGSYSYVEVKLKKGDTLYVNVGQQGTNYCPDSDTCTPAYNGGARGSMYVGGGGGATHIATKSGELMNVPIQYVYIVSGGGSGSNTGDGYTGTHDGAAGGGYSTNNAPTSNEWSSNIITGAFYGGVPKNQNNYRGDGGGYGAGVSSRNSYSTLPVRNGDGHPIGGTGYVFNPKTRNGVMYCYSRGCYLAGASFETAKTVVNNLFYDEPVVQASKLGNGYARISYIGDFTV